jgi:hypothetical protein
MKVRDRSYYEQRAETEIEAAHEASHPGAARAHYLLAACYLDLAHNPVSSGILAFAGPELAAAQPLGWPRLVAVPRLPDTCRGTAVDPVQLME